MKIALCITCKGRLDHLKRTLPVNIAATPDPDSVFVLLDYNSKDGLAGWVREEMKSHLESGKLIYYRFTEPGAFRMAHAKNVAHRLGMLEGALGLVNLDADNFAPEGFVDCVRKGLETGKSYLWAHMVKDKLPRGVSGRIAVTAGQFRIAGGYDERYHTWSPDDKDFNCRLRKLGFEGIQIDSAFLGAIPHNDTMRFREYSHIREAGLDEEFELNGREAIRVVNGGRYGLATVYRNFDSKPIRLGAVPTRVFGIGMHRTGTVSLTKALEGLSYPCAHWPDAHWAKRVWTDITTVGSSVDLDKYMAAADLPMPLIFRELDKAYPGSKFILTLRDEQPWLASVKRHFSTDNPFYAAWDNDPFTHKVHLLLYGRRKFDAEIFVQRYRRHTSEVMEYFRGRPEDLLVFDLSVGASWHELCGFLCTSIPEDRFPHENQGAHTANGIELIASNV